MFSFQIYSFKVTVIQFYEKNRKNYKFNHFYSLIFKKKLSRFEQNIDLNGIVKVCFKFESNDKSLYLNQTHNNLCKYLCHLMFNIVI